MRIISLITLLLLGCYGYGQQHIMEIYNVATTGAREDIHYLFESNTDDESGNGYSFINTNCTFGSSTPPPPQGNYTIDAALTAQYFTLPTSYTDNFPNDFTIMFWIELTSDDPANLIVEATSTSAGFLIRFNTSGNDLDVFTDGALAEFNNIASPTLNVMLHIAVDYTSTTGTLRTHVDGVESALDVGSGNIDCNLTGAWTIARQSGGTIYMDDFRIFPEVLSSSEILSIYNNPGTPLDDI